MSRFVRYSSAVETIDGGKADTFEKIVEALRRERAVTEKRYGYSIRVSHAKAHGVATGTWEILPGIPEPYAQGLFAHPRRYKALIRLAHVPGELLDDRRVSTPRGMAIKLLGIDGVKIAEHDGGATQDFVLDTGDSVPAPTAGASLAVISTVAAATPSPEGVKVTTSAASLGANTVLNAVGLNSVNLDFFGHPKRHPLAETYYSQAAMRHGDYIAKLRVRPVSPSLLTIADERLDIEEENGLRATVVKSLSLEEAVYEVAVQICTDIDAMPIENANAVWDTQDSPYVPVARLTLPAQHPYSEARRAFVEEHVSFSPAHSIDAHRPLGSIMRARLYAYPRLAAERFAANGAERIEPVTATAIPD